MSIKFTNPTVLLGYGRSTSNHVLEIAEGTDESVEFPAHDYDIEVILTPKFKPGWFEDSTYQRSNYAGGMEKRFRWLKEEPGYPAWVRADVTWPEPESQK